MNNFESFDPRSCTGPFVSYCERHEVHYMIGDGSPVEHGTEKCDAEQLATCETWRAGQIVSSCTGKGRRCTHKGIATVTVHQNDSGALEAVYAADAVENARSYAQTLADEFAEVFHIRDSGGHIIETFKPAGMARALARGIDGSPSESAPTPQPNLPSVRELPFHGGVSGVRRFRLEGGDLAAEWAKLGRRVANPGETAWCEVSVFTDGLIGGYGGAVWPSAWPLLFEALPATVQGSGGFKLTALGRQLIGMAESCADCGEPIKGKPINFMGTSSRCAKCHAVRVGGES